MRHKIAALAPVGLPAVVGVQEFRKSVAGRKRNYEPSPTNFFKGLMIELGSFYICISIPLVSISYHTIIALVFH